MTAPARRFGLLAGSAYTALGVLGLAVTGFSGFASSRGVVLLGLELNGLQNLLHFSAGMLLVVGAARNESTARILAIVAAVSFGVVGLLGIGMVGTDGNVLALNHASNALHLTTAILATTVAVRSALRATATDTTADRLVATSLRSIR